MTQSIERRLAAALAERPEIVVAYLFGSRAAGRAGERSDWDVAVLVEPEPESLIAAQVDLGEFLRAEVPNAKIDVSLLNGAAPFFWSQVLRTGRVLRERDPGERVEIEARAWHRWCDYRPYWERMNREMMTRIREGTYGRSG